ncbi:MAG TPA: hypothetical protein VGK82_12940 [Pyrinomonadaceae bacterium]
MAQNLEEVLIDKVRALPPHKQEVVLQLVDYVLKAEFSPNACSTDSRPAWEIIAKANAALPSDTWDNVPPDGSVNVDHYLYGALKRQS